MSAALRLLEERKRLGLTQRQLAARGGVCRKTQILYERGTSHPGTDYLNAVATLGVDQVYVMTGARQTAPDALPRASLLLRIAVELLEEANRLHIDASISTFDVRDRARRVLEQTLDRLSDRAVSKGETTS